jgi:hypothetical protein
MQRIKVTNGIGGGDGLIAAIIARAVNDLSGPDLAMAIDALAYLGSDHYRGHLERVGLPLDYVPVALTEITTEDFINDTKRIFERSLDNEE